MMQTAPRCRSATVLLLLAGVAACSRSGLEQPDVEATAPPPVPAVDASAPPPTPAPNLPSCSPVDETLVGEAPAPAPCGDPPPAWTAVQQLADEGYSVALASDRCGRAVAGWKDPAGVYLAWSVDGGQSFDEPLAVGPGRHPVLFLDGAGVAHAFFVRDATLVHLTLDGPDAAPVEQLLAQTGTPLIVAGEPDKHRAAAARGDRELAVTWKTSTDPTGIWFASNRATGALGVPIRIHDTPSMFHTPRLCLAGRDRVVIVWRERGTQVLSAISEDGGASFCLAPLGQEAPEVNSISENVDVACAPDGRALAVWDGVDGLRIAALSRASVWSRGDAISSDDPYFPHIYIAGDRALATWIGFAERFGYALLDLEGKLAGPNVWAADLTLDGKPDRLMRTCARDDGFVLLTQGSFTGQFTFIDLSGTPAPSQTVAPYGETAVDVALRCQLTGAAAIWRDASAVMLARWAN